jgi:hypothetical protein
MAKPLTRSQILAALNKWGVKYVEYPGWDTRTRPGGLTDVAGTVNHHTGGGSASDSYLKFLFVEGRPSEGIPGPLCNVATDATGVVHLGAIGRANHAGSGSATTLAHVRAEDYAGYKSELKPGPDGTNGNPLFYGNEWIYSGATPPTAAQYHGALLWNAAILDAHGWTALSAIAHREWTLRKNDPFGVLMHKFRLDLAALLKAGPPKPAKPPVKPPVTPPKEDTLSAQDVSDGMRDYLKDFYSPGGTGGVYHQQEVDYRTAVLAAMKDQTDAIKALAAAIAAKV